MNLQELEESLEAYGLAFESEEGKENLKETIEQIWMLSHNGSKRVERLTFLDEFAVKDVKLLAAKIELDEKHIPFLKEIKHLITIGYQSNMRRMGFIFSISDLRADVKEALENKGHPRYNFYFSLFGEGIRDEMKLKSVFETKRVEMQMVRKLTNKYTEMREHSYEKEKFEEMTEDLAIAFEKVCQQKQK